MQTYYVLQPLPKGQQPGDLVELNEDEARVFVLVGAVRAIAESLDDHEPSSTYEPKPSRRRYQRRDMTATTEG